MMHVVYLFASIGVCTTVFAVGAFVTRAAWHLGETLPPHLETMARYLVKR